MLRTVAGFAETTEGSWHGFEGLDTNERGATEFGNLILITGPEIVLMALATISTPIVMNPWLKVSGRNVMETINYFPSRSDLFLVILSPLSIG